MRYDVMASKDMRGAESAEGEVLGVMLPSGTWWRTREPWYINLKYYDERG
jgi:hypothetical protein